MQKYMTGIVVIDFHAGGCIPCREQTPLFEQAAAELAGQATFYQVDIAEEPELAIKFEVMSIPTIVLLKDGVSQWKSVGLTQTEEIVGAVRGCI